MLRLFYGNASFIHFFGLAGNVVENFADGDDALLAANLAVAGDKERAFIEGGKSFQSVAPARDGGLFIEANRIPAAEKEIAGVDDVLLGNSRDDVGAGVTGIRFENGSQPAKIDGQGQFGGIERVIGEAKNSRVCDLKNAGESVQVGLRMGAFRIRLGVFDALFERCQHGFLIRAL